MSARPERSSTPSLNRKQQRRLKNLLLDSRFQLKYSGYFAATALSVGVALGVVLWRTSGQVIVQSRASVELGREMVNQGKAFIEESEKVNSVVRMTMVDAYSDDPALLDVFQGEAARHDRALDAEQRALEQNGRQLLEHAHAIEREHRFFGAVLASGLMAFVLVIALLGVWLTHKVAGPIYKMKRLLRALGRGHFRVTARLRRGDELEDFFACFNDAADQLRQRQEEELREIGVALSELSGAESASDRERAIEAACARLRRLEQSMTNSLATVPPGL